VEARPTVLALAANFIKRRATITAMNEMPLMIKHQAGPNHIYVKPATAGPTAVAELNIVEFNAIALAKSLRSTISSTNDCRVGPSKALTTPRDEAKRMMCHGRTRCEKVNAAKIKASSIMMLCVTINNVRRATRSAITPPYSVSNHEGIPEAKPTRPKKVGERVKSYTR